MLFMLGSAYLYKSPICKHLLHMTNLLCLFPRYPHLVMGSNCQQLPVHEAASPEISHSLFYNTKSTQPPQPSSSFRSLSDTQRKTVPIQLPNLNKSVKKIAISRLIYYDHTMHQWCQIFIINAKKTDKAVSKISKESMVALQNFLKDSE